MANPVAEAGSPRLLCLSSFFAGHGGGVERVAHELACHFATVDGWDVTLAAHGELSDAPDGVPYRTFAARGWNGLEAVTGLPLVVPSPGGIAKLIGLSRKADLVVVHDEIYLSALAVLIWCVLSRKPVVVIKHTGILPFRQKPLVFLHKLLIFLIFRPLVRLCSGVVFVTEAKRARYDPKGRLTKAMVIENGVDTELFAQDSKIARARHHVCFVGRFIDRKGILIVRALAKRMPQVSFALVGWGPEDPRSWDLPNVEVLWNPERAIVARAFQGSQLSLFPGVSEGVALVTLESLACGTPVLLNAACDVPDLDLRTALEFERVDLEATEETAAIWDSKITHLLRTPVADATSRALSDIIVRGYSRQAVGQRYMELLAPLLEARSAPRNGVAD